MDESKNNSVGTETDNDQADVTTANQNTDDGVLTFTQDALKKEIQSQTDKVRTKYSREIKQLQAKIAELTPVEKSPAELKLEARLAKLEAKELEVQAKERLLGLQTALSAKNIDRGVADYLREDVDVEAFSTLIDSVINSRIKDNGYVPTGHQPNQKITKAEWDKKSYSEKVKLYESNPELVKMYMGK